MEDMKAIFRLNDEKLSFNFKVLKEREKVNKQTGDTLKKRRAEIMEAVRNEKIKFENKQKDYQHKNVKLTKDYKNYTNIFKDLQQKFERFQEADDTKTREVWSMNEKEAQELVEKIMHCDEVIHLQQLSVPWKRPSDPIFNFLNDPNSIHEEQKDESMGHQGSAMIDQSGANGSKSDLGEQQMEDETVSGP